MIDISGETGIVTEVTGSMAQVVFNMSQACDHCRSRLFCRSDGVQTRKIIAKNLIAAQVGDQVFVKESGRLLLLAALMQSGLPLAGLLIGIFLAYGYQWTVFGLRHELVMTACGLLGMLIGGYATWAWSTHMAGTLHSGFEIVSRL